MILGVPADAALSISRTKTSEVASFSVTPTTEVYHRHCPLFVQNQLHLTIKVNSHRFAVMGRRSLVKSKKLSRDIRTERMEERVSPDKKQAKS